MNYAPVRTTQKKQKKQEGDEPVWHTINRLALDVRSAAALVGTTEKTLRAMIDRRLVPFRRLNSRIIFLRAELQQWLSTLDGCNVDEAQANMAARKVL
jgi:hypothetical protein